MGGSGNDDSPDISGPGLAGLPVELAFLARHGLAPSLLARVAERSARNRTEPVREAIALGLIDEVGFYRALATEMGLAFLPQPPGLQPGGGHNAILRQGIAPTIGDARKKRGRQAVPRKESEFDR